MNAPELRSQINLHDLATRLGMRRPGDKGNYCALWRDDGTPSVSIFTGKDGIERWKDHGNGESGDAIDLVAKVRGMDGSEALKELHRMFGFQTDHPAKSTQEPRQEAPHQRIWRNARNHPSINQAFDYLVNVRKLPEAEVRKWQGKAFGFSDYKPEVAEYGPAVVFPIKDLLGVVQAVNQRYLADGHEPKMRMAGEAVGGMFCPDPAILKKPVIWLVESPIDALTLTAAGCPAISFLTTSNAESFPLSWLNEKQRLMILGDADPAGKKAQESLYHRAISAGTTVQVVDWPKDYKDPNAALQAGWKLEQLAELAKKANQSVFPANAPWIPEPEYKQLWMYDCGLDTTDAVKLREVDGVQEKTLEPVAGFRVFRIDPITVHDPVTALGEGMRDDASPRYLVHYRRTDHPGLQRNIVDQRDIGKPAIWQGFGHLHNHRTLARLLQTLGRDQRHAQETVGVIGLVRVGKNIRTLDASNTYLEEKECIYHRLKIPSAPHEKAKPILIKLNGLLKNGTGLVWFAWHLGALMKVFLGFWPHMAINGHAGSGKTLIASRVMAGLTNCILQEPTELDTSYRRMKVVSNHIYPIIIDEISRANSSSLKEFVNILNSSFRYTSRRHGDRQLLQCAPVAMVGQDNPIDDPAISSKIISFNLNGLKIEGGLFTPSGPFPVQEWAKWLVDRWDKEKAETRLKMHKEALSQRLKAKQGDSNLDRFLENYAALAFAMEELFEFADYQNPQCFESLVAIMNGHLWDSEVIRRESVGILDRLAQIMLDPKERERFPHKVEDGKLIIPTKNILPFLAQRGHEFPVKTSQTLSHHLKQDGFLLEGNSSRNINGMKTKSVVLDLKAIEEAGITWPVLDSDYQERKP